MDRIHDVHVVERETSPRMCVVRVATHGDPSHYQTWLSVAWDLDWHVKSSSEDGKAWLGCGETKARQRLTIEGHLFYWPEVGECKETMKDARKRLEVRMGAAMSCNMVTRKRARRLRENCSEWEHQLSQENQVFQYCGSSRVHKEAFGITLPRNHEDHIAEKGFNSINHYTKLFPYPKQWKCRMQKPQWTKHGRSSRRCQHGNWIR